MIHSDTTQMLPSVSFAGMDVPPEITYAPVLSRTETTILRLLSETEPRTAQEIARHFFGRPDEREARVRAMLDKLWWVDLVCLDGSTKPHGWTLTAAGAAVLAGDVA